MANLGGLVDVFSELRPFHQDMLIRYVEYWTDPALREQDNVDEQMTAYCLLEHASQLDLIDDSQQRLNVLRELPADERRKIIMLACEYTAGINLAEQFKFHCRDEALETEQLEFVESLVITRGKLDAVMKILVSVCSDLVDNDAELRTAIANAICVTAEIDDAMEERPDIIGVLTGTPTMNDEAEWECLLSASR